MALPRDIDDRIDDHEADPTAHAAAIAAEAAAAAAAAVATHAGAADPHTGYQKESEKGAANGYAGLGAGSLVPMAQLATGTPDGTKFIRDDGTLQVPTATPADHNHTAPGDGGTLTNAVVDGYLDVTEIAVPGNPGAGVLRLYSKNRGGRTIFAFKTEVGLEVELSDQTNIVRNQTGSTLTTGTVVYLTGSIGSGVALVDKSDADDVNTLPVFGVLMEDIANNANGRIMIQGLMVMDTSALSTGRAFVSQTAGGLTNSEPAHPALRQRVGYVITVGASGFFFVFTASLRGDHEGTIQNTWKIGDAAAGAKSVQFVAAGANIGTLQMTPTGARTVTVQDSTHTLENTAHAAKHKVGGSDAIKLNELANPDASVQFAQQQALQLRIENRTSDPGSPAAGEIWLRTDL